MGTGFIVIVLLTRYLGPDNFGLLSYSQSFIGIFVAFSTLGLEVILVRELTKNKDQTDTILGTALVLKMLASLSTIVVIAIINIYVDDKEASLLTSIIAFGIIFQSLNLGVDTYFQANVLSKFSAISNVVAFTVSSIFKILLIIFEADLVYFAIALVFDSICIFTGYVYILFLQKKSIITLKYNNKMALYFLKNAWPMMMVSMAVFLYTKIDQVMIKHLLDNKSVGYYSAAIKVSEIFYFIPLLITQSVFPRLVKVRNDGDEKKYLGLLEVVYKLVLWIAIPISIMLVIFSSYIVNILYGSSFSASSNILSILGFGLILVSIGSVNTKILYIEHYEKKYLKRSLFGVFINIFLNYILIQKYGASGAAISTLITLFMIHYVYDLLDRDLWRFYHLKYTCFIPKGFNLSEQS
jgi:O-antigen/teichoic acid export membrane protein